LTKLVSENKTNYDEHMSIVLISYKTAYKIAIGYTPCQLMYELHPLKPTSTSFQLLVEME
jgi:hypothetical protein